MRTTEDARPIEPVESDEQRIRELQRLMAEVEAARLHYHWLALRLRLLTEEVIAHG